MTLASVWLPVASRVRRGVVMLSEERGTSYGNTMNLRDKAITFHFSFRSFFLRSLILKTREILFSCNKVPK